MNAPSAAPPWPARTLPDDKAAARRLARESLRDAPHSAGSSAMSRALDAGVLPATGRMAVYVPMPDEVPLDPVTTAAWCSRAAYVRMEGAHSLTLHAWDGVAAFLTQGTGPRAPAGPEAWWPLVPEVACVLVPGLAFAPDGRRLGRGKGFYDRWLAAHPHVPRVAITSERHLWSHLPTDPWDMRVDVVVTESRVHRVVRG